MFLTTKCPKVWELTIIRLKRWAVWKRNCRKTHYPIGNWQRNMTWSILTWEWRSQVPVSRFTRDKVRSCSVRWLTSSWMKPVNPVIRKSCRRQLWMLLPVMVRASCLTRKGRCIIAKWMIFIWSRQPKSQLLISTVMLSSMKSSCRSRTAPIRNVSVAKPALMEKMCADWTVCMSSLKWNWFALTNRNTPNSLIKKCWIT